MPKRGAKSRIERYARKIRKLEEKEKRRKIISPFGSSSESDNEGKQKFMLLLGRYLSIKCSKRNNLSNLRDYGYFGMDRESITLIFRKLVTLITS